MAQQTKIFGKIRGIMMDLLPAGREDEQPHLSGQAEQLIALGSAPYQEIVRQGRAFMANTGTAVATAIAIPATAVFGFIIYNNESDGGRSYMIDQIGALYTVNSGNALAHVGMIGCLGTVREAVPTAAAITPRQLNGMGNMDTKARFVLTGDNAWALGATLAPPTSVFTANWFPIGNSVNTAVNALPGFQTVANLDGRIIIPPGRLFAVHTLGSVITSSAQIFISWHEKVIVNG